MFSQAAHQVDIVRLLGGGRVRTVRAATGAWDPARRTEGAYSAFLTFEDGAFATIDLQRLRPFRHGRVQRMDRRAGPAAGPRRATARPAAKLREIASPEAEAALKNTRAYGSPSAAAAASNQDPGAHNHFGLVVVSCDRADIRPMPQGVQIYADDARTLDPLPPPTVPRAEVVDELYEAAVNGRPRSIRASGAWRRWRSASRSCNPPGKGAS